MTSNELEGLNKIKRQLAKVEVIRTYDNSKFGVDHWYGRKEYAHMTLSEVDARLAEITMEKAKYHG